MTQEKKPLGRPPKQAAIPADSIPEDEDPRDPNAGKRPERVQLGRGNLNLRYPEHLMDRENFNYYWGLDNPARPGRIDYLLSRGYEHDTKQGKKVQKPAGACTHFLLKLPMQFYLEDKAAKKQIILAKSASHNKIGANEYAPDPKTGDGQGGTTAVTRDGSNPFS